MKRLLARALDRSLALREYTVTTSKLPTGAKLRIAIVSDLHATSFGNGQRELWELLRRARPDFIAMTGDIFDDKRPVAPALQAIRAAASVAPVYYVTGNHEYYMNAVAAKKYAAREGARVLRDRVAVFDRGDVSVLVGGIDDCSVGKRRPTDSDARLRRAFAPVADDGRFSVLLVHRPGHGGEYDGFGFDLVLSGHNHGGQVCLPGLCEGVFAPDLRLFPEWPGGVYRTGGQVHVISRGLALFPFLPRVCNPPELVLVTVAGV